MGQVLLELNVQIDFCSSQIFLREAVIFRYQSHREWLVSTVIFWLFYAQTCSRDLETVCSVYAQVGNISELKSISGSRNFQDQWEYSEDLHLSRCSVLAFLPCFSPLCFTPSPAPFPKIWRRWVAIVFWVIVIMMVMLSPKHPSRALT